MRMFSWVMVCWYHGINMEYSNPYKVVKEKDIFIPMTYDDHWALGDGVTGTEKDARHSVRCLSIGWMDAVEEICEILEKKGIKDPKHFLGIKR